MLEMGKSLPVLLGHLNSFNCFLLEMNPRGPKLFTFSWDFIDSNHRKVVILKVKGFKLFNKLWIQPPGQFVQYN